MSGESIPIELAAFAEAIKELPLPVLYAKVLELRNSIAHLHRSNNELKQFVAESCDSEDEKRELETYIAENEDVAISMTERISRLKAEVEGRGQQWIEVEEIEDTKATSDQPTTTSTHSGTNGTISNGDASTQQNPSTTGSADRPNDEDQDGVYL